MDASHVRSVFRAGAIALALALSIARPATAQWSTDPTVNTPVCTFAGAQLKSVAVSDGSGGVIIAWADNRDPFPAPADIYAQRFDAAGNAMWTPASGVVVCAATGDQDNAAITSDGAGGAIISWDDFRASGTGGSWDLYAQHVDAGGTVLWAPNGVLVGASAADDIWSMLVPDDTGGAFVTWESGAGFAAATYDIFAQHLDGATGAPLWPAGPSGGVTICGFAGGQQMPMLVRSGPGVIISWYDSRGGTEDVYAQRVSGGGTPLWIADGVAICAAAGDQSQPNIAGDGADGAIITWYDSRGGAANLDIYAQHVNLFGALLWAPLGLPICAVPASNQQWPKIVSDGSGGAIIAWYDARSGANDIYAQRVTGGGALPWASPGGVAVCVAAGAQDRAKVVSDGAGGAIVAWRDGRSFTNTDIYAQRLDGATGAAQWTVGGVAVSTAPLDQDWWDQHVPMIADGQGGAIVSWRDCRVGPPAAPPTDIYAQRVSGDGVLGGATFVNFVTFESPSGFGAAIATAGNDGSAVLTGGGASIVRFDANGTPEWARGYSVSGDEFLIGTSIARMPDGWAAAGSLYEPSTGRRYASLMRLNESGDVLWAVRDEDFSEAHAVVRASDGGIVTTGWSVLSLGGGPIDAHAFVTRFDAAGTRTWTTFLNSAISNSRPNALVETSDGGFAVAGIAFLNPYERIFLARFDGSGGLLWSLAFTVDGGSAYGPVALSTTADGGFVLGASLFLSSSGTSDSRLMLARFDGSGSLLWSNSMADGEPIYRGAGVSADATGFYLCASLNPGGAESDAVVIRANAAGTFEWLRRIRGSQDYSTGSALTPVAGGVLVTGFLASEIMLANVSPDGATCLGSLEIPTSASISVVPVDPLCIELQGDPVFTSFSPASTVLTTGFANCPVPVGVPRTFESPRIDDGAIGMRITAPAADRLMCRLALPRPLALRAQWFDLSGRQVSRGFELGELPAGDHSIQLERPEVGNGIYLLEVRGGGLRGVAKAVLLR